MIKINFNQWVYGVYCGLIIEKAVNGDYISILFPLGFMFMFIGYELIINQKKHNDANVSGDEQ